MELWYLSIFWMFWFLSLNYLSFRDTVEQQVQKWELGPLLRPRTADLGVAGCLSKKEKKILSITFLIARSPRFSLTGYFVSCEVSSWVVGLDSHPTWCLFPTHHSLHATCFILCPPTLTLKSKNNTKQTKHILSIIVKINTKAVCVCGCYVFFWISLLSLACALEQLLDHLKRQWRSQVSCTIILRIMGWAVWEQQDVSSRE